MQIKVLFFFPLFATVSLIHSCYIIYLLYIIQNKNTLVCFKTEPKPNEYQKRDRETVFGCSTTRQSPRFAVKRLHIVVHTHVSAMQRSPSRHLGRAVRLLRRLLETQLLGDTVCYCLSVGFLAKTLNETKPAALWSDGCEPVDI